jgi:tripartite-type tricarboxylate transporter receptor subunit TctC
MTSRPISTGSLLLTAAVEQKRFVKLSGAKSGAGEYAVGISQFAGAIGDYIPYTELGNEEVEAGAAFSAGDLLQSDSLGRAVKAGTPNVATAVVNGGAAGNLTVTGITTSDRLIGVYKIPGAGSTVTDFLNLTSEFTITAADTINNTGGTTTASSKVLVLYERSIGKILARSRQASTGAGQFAEVSMIPN